MATASAYGRYVQRTHGVSVHPASSRRVTAQVRPCPEPIFTSSDEEKCGPRLNSAFDTYSVDFVYESVAYGRILVLRTLLNSDVNILSLRCVEY